MHKLYKIIFAYSMHISLDEEMRMHKVGYTGAKWPP